MICSLGWLGAVTLIAFLALAAANTSDRSLAHALYRAIDTSLSVTLALGILALTTGAVLGVGTHWGILRHWWVSAKLVITLAVIVADLFIIRHAVHTALHTVRPPGDLAGVSVGHTVVLALAAVIAVYKPWGPTPFAQRRASDGTLPATKTPR